MPLNTQTYLQTKRGRIALCSAAAGMITSHMNGVVHEASVQVQSHRERAVDCPGEEDSLVKSPHASAYMDKIGHYQEDLKRRKEEDGHGILNIDPSSPLLHKKLSQNPKVGIDNPTFEGKEEAKDVCSQDLVAGEFR